MAQNQIVIDLTPEAAEKLAKNVKGLEHVKHKGNHTGHVEHPESGETLFNFSFDTATGKLTVSLPDGVSPQEAETRIRQDIAILTK